jgi:hypothetical protein
VRRALLVLALLAGCKSDFAVSRETVDVACDGLPFTGKKRILVMDEQFNPSLAHFRGRVASCYRYDCSSSDGESCRIVPGLKLQRRLLEQPSPRDPEAWNRAMRGKMVPDSFVDQVEYRSLGVGPFGDHGTATASLAMLASEDAELVLLQTPLRDDEKPITCPSRDKVQLEIDGVAEEARQPLAQDEKDLLDLIRRERVNVIGQSFGLTRDDLEGVCRGLPWQDWLRAKNEAAHRREDLLSAQGAFEGISVLVVRAAGNETLKVNDTRDALDLCDSERYSGFGPASARLVIGSFDPASDQFSLSSFTNYGSCVDVYAPGEGLLAPDAKGTIRVFMGTSAAAPLVVGLAAKRWAGAAQTRRLLREVLPARRRLEPSQFPPSMFVYRKDAPYTE